MSSPEDLRQAHLAREANQSRTMQIDQAPAITGPLATPIVNPFAAVGGYRPIEPDANGADAQAQQNFQQVFNAIRFQQSNILLPQQNGDAATSLAEIASSVANLSNSVALFGTAQETSNQQLRQFGAQTVNTTADTLAKMVTHTGQVQSFLANSIAQSDARTHAHIGRVAEAVADSARAHRAPDGATAAAASTTDPTLISILEKISEGITANQSKQATVATTEEHLEALDNALNVLQVRAKGKLLEDVQAAHHNLDQYRRLSGITTLGAAQGDLADAKRQWHQTDLLHLQHLLSKCQHVALDSAFDRTRARLAFLPFFMEKNHCKTWFEPQKGGDNRNNPTDGSGGKDRASRFNASRKDKARIRQLEAQLKGSKSDHKKPPGADKGVGNG